MAMKMVRKRVRWMAIGFAMLPLLSLASEVTVPNTFVAGTKAVADEVNANFSATETAINDNHDRISALETAVEELQTSPGLVVDTFYFADLLYILSNGDLVVADPAGSETVGAGVDWHPVPGLTDVSFNVENDETVVIFQSVGEMLLSSFDVYNQANIALEIDGVIPDKGARQTLRLVSDETTSSGGQSWHLLHAQTLNAGMHTFTVLLKGHQQNDSTVTIDERDGRSKVVLMQIQ